jgi:hypothetical protein
VPVPGETYVVPLADLRRFLHEIDPTALPSAPDGRGCPPVGAQRLSVSGAARPAAPPHEGEGPEGLSGPSRCARRVVLSYRSPTSRFPRLVPTHGAYFFWTCKDVTTFCPPFSS